MLHLISSPQLATELQIILLISRFYIVVLLFLPFYMSYQIFYGGGGNVLGKSHCISPKEKINLKFFVKCAEERRIRVRDGERLMPVVKAQKDRIIKHSV